MRKTLIGLTALGGILAMTAYGAQAAPRPTTAAHHTKGGTPRRPTTTGTTNIGTTATGSITTGTTTEPATGRRVRALGRAPTLITSPPGAPLKSAARRTVIPDYEPEGSFARRYSPIRIAVGSVTSFSRSRSAAIC